MFGGLRQKISIVALTAAMLVCAGGATAAADPAGTVHFAGSADSSFDQFTASPTAETQAWLRAHMWRMLVWSPYFDERTSWYAQGWMYDDSYAIYTGSPLASQHPEWILKDASGNDLYIPYECGAGSCPQYAADISNPAYRHYWIEQARARLAHGYRGLFVDDVNMEERVGNAAEAPVTPIGLGGVISPGAWRSYMAEFMAEIRAALPTIEIVHNVIWFADADAGIGDPSIRREIESANYVMLERGVNDAGLTGGNGPWSLNAFLSFADQVHSLGRGVVLDGASAEPQGMEYNLASYFLISTGNDAVSSKGQTPDSWWPGFEMNLGEAIDARYSWNGLLRRDFTGGMALVNPPGSPAQTVALPSPMRDADGQLLTTVTLAPASGAVLSGAGALPAPAPAAQAVASSESATQTILEARVVHPLAAAARTARRSARRARATQSAAHAAAAASPGRLLARIGGVVRGANRGNVVIAIQRLGHGRWMTLRKVTVAISASGRFLSLARLHAGASYRLSATFTGVDGLRPSWSGYRLVMARTR